MTVHEVDNRVIGQFLNTNEENQRIAENSTTLFYSFHPFNFYCGDAKQPTSFRTFTTTDEKFSYFYIPIYRALGYIPYISIISGVCRIVQATKRLFKELATTKLSNIKTRSYAEPINACKNIGRGLVEVVLPLIGVPVLGCLGLAILDIHRETNFNPRNSNVTKDYPKHVGVLIDGKVIYAIEMATVKKFFNKINIKRGTDKEYRTLFDYFCLQSIQKYAKNSEITLVEALEKTKENLLKIANE